MSLSRQQKRQIERKAKAYMRAIDADLVARLKAEQRGLLHSTGQHYTTVWGAQKRSLIS